MCLCVSTRPLLIWKVRPRLLVLLNQKDLRLQIDGLMRGRWIATPLAASAGIKPRVHLRVQDEPILEAYFTSQGKNPPQVNETLLTNPSKTCFSSWLRKKNKNKNHLWDFEIVFLFVKTATLCLSCSTSEVHRVSINRSYLPKLLQVVLSGD